MLKIEPTYIYLLLFTGFYVLFILLKKLYLPRLYGSWGEYLVARKLKRLRTEDYKIYNNIYLEKNGRTTQIDHLVISIFGIFVIETKNYKGWIFGNEKSKYWTQTLYRKKYKLYNPVIQNWKHINFIKSLSKSFRDQHFHSIVVFAGQSKLKNMVSSIPVIKKRRLLRTIRKNKNVILTHQQLLEKCEIIDSHILTGKSIRKKHRKNVKKVIKKNRKNHDIDTCPKCGGRLAIKNGKHGQFYGCANFPRCKYTVKLNS